jgi:nitrate/TMAO reductase-like tetraheme cytochrome c subunit
MSPFISGMLVFFLLCLGMGALIFYTVRSQGRREFKISRRAFTYSLLIPVLLGVVFLGFFAFYEYHETPEFCGELCHAMGPKYEGYEHPENNQMMITHKEEGVPCTGCHVGPGWTGQVAALASVPQEFISEAFNLYDINDLGGIMHEEQCWKCHDGSHAIKPGEVKSVTGDLVDPHTGEEVCFNCHPAHSAGFGVSLDTCVLCHGHALDDWDTSMERHGNRTGGDCLSCHDRNHPEDARVPWEDVANILENNGMEFCNDCHPTEYDNWMDSATEESHELYGECLDCHTEHLSSTAFHYVGDEYTNCNWCHPQYNVTGGIHDRTGVTFLGVPDVSNDLCQACHPDEEDGLDEEPQHRGLDCVFCHQDHLVNLRVEFDRCWICHDEDSLPEHTTHDENLTGCSCHGSGWNH